MNIELYLKKYNWAINLFALGIIGLMLANIIMNVVGAQLYISGEKIDNGQLERIKNERVIKKSLDKKVYETISDRNIFDSKNTQKSLEQVIVDEANKNVVRSKIAAKLLGTVIMSIPEYSIATIFYQNQTDQYSLNDRLEDGVIVDIQRNKVLINRGGYVEYLEVEGLHSEEDMASKSSTGSKGGVGNVEDGIYKKSENEFEIAREKLEASLSDINNILREARAVPYMVQGQMQGFKILSIRYKSIFRELGLKNGDVIEQVNGKNLDSIESSLGLFQDLRNASNFTINVQRQGKKESLRYEVK